LSKTSRPKSIKRDRNYPVVKRIQVSSNKEPDPLQREVGNHRNVRKRCSHLNVLFLRTMKTECWILHESILTWNKGKLVKIIAPRVRWGKWKWNAYLILGKYFYIGQDGHTFVLQYRIFIFKDRWYKQTFFFKIMKITTKVMFI
jgi:hypothetical protein